MDWNLIKSMAFPLMFAAGGAGLFGYLYTQFGETSSNRAKFAGNFVLLAVITTAIIMIIKNSIALSLGLVGALSIVRFRAAIKEPEELVYLFLMIGIGIGAGAGEYILISVLACVAFLIIVGKRLISRSRTKRFAYNLNIVSSKGKESGVESMIQLFAPFTSRLSLKRFDEDKEKIDALFYAEYKDEGAFYEWRKKLLAFDSDVRISYLEEEGVF